ncbi:MAG: imidazolonepropionase, partial [Chloroflexota bacterium]
METKPKADLLISGASQVWTCVPSPGGPAGRIENGAIAIAGERILAVGPSAQVAATVDAAAAIR